MSTWNVLSLFSGIGGLDLGLQRAGMTIVGQVEIDPWCRSILAKHWPEVPRHDDVRTAAAWWLAPVADAVSEGLAQREGEPGDDGPQLPAAERSRGLADAASHGRPAVDLVCGGFPCQPTSGAGKREVEADSRWLWPAMAAVIRDLGPRYVLVENPSSGFFAPAAVKDSDGRVVGYSRAPIEIVVGDLAALGYDCEWDCVPACFVGAPHIRDRVWIVAYPQRHGPAGSRHELADANRAARYAARPASETVFRPSQEQRPRRCGCGERHAWPAEPGVGRVAHGIPRRVDRLRGLGNAVVPQVAEHLGRLIMQADSQP